MSKDKDKDECSDGSNKVILFVSFRLCRWLLFWVKCRSCFRRSILSIWILWWMERIWMLPKNSSSFSKYKHHWYKISINKMWSRISLKGKNPKKKSFKKKKKKLKIDRKIKWKWKRKKKRKRNRSINNNKNRKRYKTIDLQLNRK